MKKLLVIIVLGLLLSGNAFAKVDKKLLKDMSNGCIYAAKANNDYGSEAKKFCKCMTNTFNKKMNTSQFKKYLNSSQSQQNKWMKENVTPVCLGGSNAISNVPINLTCYMNNPDQGMISPHRLTLLPDSKTFVAHVDGQTGYYRESSSWYGGDYYHDDIKIVWKLNRNTGTIIYEISRGSNKIVQTGECNRSKSKKF